jgi:hypothetical protein
MAADDATEADFHQALGEMVVHWNACEGRLREMVIWLAGGRSPATLALTAHMGAKALTDALPALTGEKSAEIREHFEWFAKGVDILREHRNYYAHGISFVSPGMVSPGVAAWVSHVTGKLRVKITHDRIPLETLRALCVLMMIYSYYGLRLMELADPHRGMFGLGRRVLHGPSPSKPPLPDRLRKPPPILIGAPPPPGS